MNTSEAFAAIACHQIALTPCFDGQYWVASVDENGDTISTKKRKVKSISARSSTPLGAIESLLAILNQQPQEPEEDEFWPLAPDLNITPEGWEVPF